MVKSPLLSKALDTSDHEVLDICPIDFLCVSELWSGESGDSGEAFNGFAAIC